MRRKILLLVLVLALFVAGALSLWDAMLSPRPPLPLPPVDLTGTTSVQRLGTQFAWDYWGMMACAVPNQIYPNQAQYIAGRFTQAAAATARAQTPTPSPTFAPMLATMQG